MRSSGRKVLDRGEYKEFKYCSCVPPSNARPCLPSCLPCSACCANTRLRQPLMSVCARRHCKRMMVWRKAWERCWDEVKFCRCSRVFALCPGLCAVGPVSAAGSPTRARARTHTHTHILHTHTHTQTHILHARAHRHTHTQRARSLSLPPSLSLSLSVINAESNPKGRDQLYHQTTRTQHQPQSRSTCTKWRHRSVHSETATGASPYWTKVTRHENSSSIRSHQRSGTRPRTRPTLLSKRRQGGRERGRGRGRGGRERDFIRKQCP